MALRSRLIKKGGKLVYHSWLVSGLVVVSAILIYQVIVRGLGGSVILGFAAAMITIWICGRLRNRFPQTDAKLESWVKSLVGK